MQILGTYSSNPHAYLGLQGKMIRVWNPDVETLEIEVSGKRIAATRIDPEGLFECAVDEDLTAQEYKIPLPDGRWIHDPYSFSKTASDNDLGLFSKGVHWSLYDFLGGRLTAIDGIFGVKFSTWAPNAKSVAVMGDFCEFGFPMRRLGETGVWELFIPGLEEGETYQFDVLGADGKTRRKADSFALSSELRPGRASVVADLNRFQWSDAIWMERRSKKSAPMMIYEVHLGSWKSGNELFPNYRTLAEDLGNYCTEMGFTHVELLPISEHPLDESWGYQVSGYFSVTSRYGSPEDFQFFVDHMHKMGIGVILDWVPGHFPDDDFALSKFDGTELFEHANPERGVHPLWDTLIFDYEKKEVVNFLIASALFWFDKMHIDGLRVDAVSSVLHLDYGREEGNWTANIHGGNENLEGIEFIKQLNVVVKQRFPSVWMIAEESSTFPGVTKPVAEGGLGFDGKWNLGWMNDTLRYFSARSEERSKHHSDLTFGLTYLFSERFFSPLSHDEVVHSKKSLFSKMPEEPFANLCLLYSYMICYPGKKVFFMGGEFGQKSEWNCLRPLDWELLNDPKHKEILEFVKKMNHFYLDHPALWERDFDWGGFEWVTCDDREKGVIAYYRKSEKETLLCVHNFQSVYHDGYFLPVDADLKVLLGRGINGKTIDLPPLSTTIMSVL